MFLMPAVRRKGSRIVTPSQTELAVADAADETAYAKPFVKWAGGKTQLLPQLARFYPPKGSVQRYIEPFLGSGAVFFHVKAKVEPRESLLWDNNQELIDTFVAVRDDVEEVIRRLQAHERKHGRDYFLAMRTKLARKLPDVAARLIYLNKTCFNGLFRVNSKGIFNVPFGRYPKPSILNPEGLRQASRALAGARVEQEDFKMLLVEARRGDLIYFDPPYHPRSATAYFTSYTRDAFAEKDQRALAKVYRELDRRGCLLMLSNSDTPLIRELYKDFALRQVSARRLINSRADRRGAISELVILNEKLVQAARERA
jgi:DNA adenine methylase